MFFGWNVIEYNLFNICGKFTSKYITVRIIDATTEFIYMCELFEK